MYYLKGFIKGFQGTTSQENTLETEDNVSNPQDESQLSDDQLEQNELQINIPFSNDGAGENLKSLWFSYKQCQDKDRNAKETKLALKAFLSEFKSVYNLWLVDQNGQAPKRSSRIHSSTANKKAPSRSKSTITNTTTSSKANSTAAAAASSNSAAATTAAAATPASQVNTTSRKKTFFSLSSAPEEVEEMIRISALQVSGHPTNVIEEICKLLEDLTTEIVQLLGAENQLKKVFTYPEQYHMIEITEILSRSSHNRFILKEKDIIKHIVKLIQTSLQRLKNMVLFKDSDIDDIKSNVYLSKLMDFIKDILYVCFKIMLNFTESPNCLNSEMFAQSSRILMLTRQKSYIPSRKQRVRIMSQYLSQEDAITVLMESLSTFQLIQEKNSTVNFVFALQEASIYIVRSIMHSHTGNKLDKFTEEKGTSILVEYLNWPGELRSLLKGTMWRDINVKLIEPFRLKMHYELQMLTLRVLEEAVENWKYLDVLEEVNTLDRIVECGLWISLFCSLDEDLEGIVDALKENSTPNLNLAIRHPTIPSEQGGSTFHNSPLQTKKMKLHHQKEKSSDVQLSKQFPCPGFIKKLANKRILQFFECISSFVTSSKHFQQQQQQQPQPQLKTAFKNSSSSNSETISDDDDDDDAVQTKLVCLVLRFFMDTKNTPPHIEAARKKLRCFSDFQLYFMDSLILLVSKVPKLLDIYISQGLYDIFFSDYFYFYGGPHNIINKAMPKKYKDHSRTSSPIIGSATNTENIAADEEYDSDSTDRNLVVYWTSQVLRESVLTFIKYASTLPYRLHVHEIRKLVEILGSYSDNASLVSEVGACLLDILYNRSQETLEILFKYKSISVISHTTQVQQKRLQKLTPETNEIGEQNSDYVKTAQARNICLSILDVMLSDESNRWIAMEDSNSLNTLFLCLFDTFLKDFALGHIADMMDTLVDDSNNIDILLGGYSEVFPVIKNDPSDQNLQLLLEMLEAVRNVLRGRNKKHLQRHFRQRLDKFMDLMNFNSNQFENKSVTHHQLCRSVLKTLTLLLADNEKSKIYMREHVGYDSMADLILRCEKNSPSQAIFDELLDMLVEDKFDSHTRYQIKIPDVIPVMFHLCLHCSTEFVQEFLEIFIRITEKSIHNQYSCCSIQLISILIDLIEKFEDKFQKGGEVMGISGSIVYLIEVIATNSISVKELKSFFSLVKRQSENVRSSLLPLLLRSLKSITKKAPEGFFDLDGKKSGLILPSIEKWPSTSKGYTILLWVRFEDYIDFPRDMKSRLFSFMSSDGNGLEVIVEQNTSLVIVSHFGPGKSETKPLSDYHFNPHQWYCLTLIHSGKSISFSKRSELKMYVDGKLVSTTQLKYPQAKTLEYCRIGTNAIIPGLLGFEKEHSIECQMTTIYIFDEALNPNTVKNIHDLGYSNMSTFSPNEIALFDRPIMSLFDGTLNSKIYLCYNPKARIGKYVLNNVPDAHQSEMNLQIMKGTQLCVTHNAKDIIGCLGGIKVLFPLFLQMDKLSHTNVDTDKFDPYRINALIQLVVDLLRDHRNNQEDMSRCKGFQVIGFLLKNISPQHLTDQTIHIFPDLLRAVIDSEALYCDAVTFLLFDFKLWIYTNPEVQKLLVSELHAYVSKIKCHKFRDIIGIQHMLDLMRWFYWFKSEKPEISLGTEKICNPVTGTLLGARPPEKDIVEIRNVMLKLIKTTMGLHPTFDEISAILNFLASCRDAFQLLDVTRFMLELLLLPNASATTISEYIAACNGLNVFICLLNVPHEQVRVLSLKCIGKFLMLHPKTRSKFDQTYSFSFISSLLYAFPFTEATYRALRDIFLGAVTLGETGSGTNYEEVDDNSHQYEIHAVLASIFKLLLNAEIDVKVAVLQDWKLHMKYDAIQEIILQRIGWQTWMFDLLANCSNEQNTNPQFVNIVQDILTEMICMLLYFSLLKIKEGWRVVEETISYLYLFESRGVLSSSQVLHKIFNRILDWYKLEKKHLLTVLMDKNSPILDNFLHLVSYIEEYLFYSHTLSQLLSNNAWLKKSESFSVLTNLSESLKNVVGAGSQSTPATPSDDQMSVASMTTMPSSNNLSASISRSSSSVSSRVKQKGYNADYEIRKRRDENGEWIDLVLCEKVLILLDTWKLNAVANFNALGAAVQGTRKLRQGGALRIALRLTRYSLRESSNVNIKNIECIKQIIQRDVESWNQMQRFSELWAVTGDLDDGVDFQNRLYFVLAFMFETCDILLKKGNAKDALVIFRNIHQIFLLRRKALESELKNEDGTLILKPNFPLFSKSVKLELSDYEAVLGTAGWDYVFTKYLMGAVRKVEEEEQAFIGSILARRKEILNRVHVKTKQTILAEEDYEKKQYIEFKTVVLDGIRPSESSRIVSAKNKIEDIDRATSRLWKRIMRNVTDERGPWGAVTAENDVKWKLNKTENKSRMRMKLKRDYSDIDHTGAAVDDFDLENKSEVEKKEKKKTTVNQLLQTKEQSSFFIPKLAIVKELESKKDEEEEDIKSTLDDIISQEDSISVEKSLLSVYCEIVTPMQAFSGRLELTTKRLIWNADRENKCESFGMNQQTLALQTTPKDTVILVEDIKEIHLRRYRLRKSAIEVFMRNETNIFFNLKKEDRNRVYKKILATKPPNLELIHQISSPADNLVRSGITKLWSKGLISNFDYLMKLNTFAGRTYNDLSQYPVFPWIIADYISEKIDLQDKKYYRDLSKPVGALNARRLEQLKDRYDCFVDPVIPKFHYGSHYSSAGIVLYYLVRLEPFTTYFRILQGGKFDHADRMFDSIPQTFDNVLTGADFKELIPEFFYCPEIFQIRNKLYLGTKQSGAKLGDSKLPPWAETHEEFVRLNRKALESDYVSDHLHEWIDLIFGYKQKGKAAEEAYNVFYYLTYEGTVDIDAIEDEVQRRSTIAQIENFGQTPSQLFTKPHVKRQKRDEALRSLMYNPTSIQFSTIKPIAAMNMSIVYLKAFPDVGKIVAVSKSGYIYFMKYVTSSQTSTTLGVNIGGSSTSNFDIIQKKKIIFPQSQEVNISEQCFAITSANKDLLFSCAHWDYSIRCSKPLSSYGQHCQNIWRHKDLVCCMTICEDSSSGTYLVTGSKDTTVMIWDIDAGSSSSPINPHPRSILYGHDDEITCLAASADLDIVASGSKDRTVILHTLRQGTYIRSIKHPNNGKIHLVALSIETGHILIYSKDDLMIHMYTVNGKLLKSVEACEVLNTMFIYDSRLVFCGGDKGVVTCRKLHSLKIIHKYDVRDGGLKQVSPIKSLAISPDERAVLAGLQNGCMAVWSLKTHVT